MDGDLGAAVVHVFDTGHRHCQKVGSAFARGCGAQFDRALTRMPGTGVFYGILRGLGPLLREYQAAGQPWVYLDNGYIGRGHYTGFYRASLNRYQHAGDGDPDYVRLSDLAVSIRPWRKGACVLVCPPGPEYVEHHGLGDWLGETLAILESSTDRPIVVRGKADTAPLARALVDAHALVTHASNAAVEAVLAGTPVFCTGDCAASPMAKSDLAQIDDPVYPDDRDRWAAVLAANQWTLDEMRRGDAWRALSVS